MHARGFFFFFFAKKGFKYKRKKDKPKRPEGAPQRHSQGRRRCPAMKAATTEAREAHNGTTRFLRCTFFCGLQHLRESNYMNITLRIVRCSC